jgi:hypothetical protein
MLHGSLACVWLPDMDSNHDKQIQNLLCYHYTIGQLMDPKTNLKSPRVKFRRDGSGRFALRERGGS